MYVLRRRSLPVPGVPGTGTLDELQGADHSLVMTVRRLVRRGVAARCREEVPGTEHLLGYTRAEFLHPHVPDIVALAPDQVRAMCDVFVRDGRWRGDIELLRKDGTAMQAGTRATALALPDGPLFVSALRDLSERRRASSARGILAQAGALVSAPHPVRASVLAPERNWRSPRRHHVPV